MRPIFWGIVGSVVGALGWILFTVFAVVSFGHEVFKFLANAFGILMVAGIPFGILVELIKFLRKK